MDKLIDKMPNYSVLYDGKSSYKEAKIVKEIILPEEQIRRIVEFKAKMNEIKKELTQHYNDFPNRNLGDALTDIDGSLKALNAFLINLN